MPTPRLLLFGPAGAGKSSLLGALVQAANSQSSQLKGELVGASTELNELRKTTYQAAPATTPELTAYDIRLQPEAGAAFSATLLDCSGEAAKEMLQSKKPFDQQHPMQKPILDADGVLFTLDASLTSKQLGEEFQQFTRWLTQFHEVRGKQTEVGDLPVYLVLTKCDLLAKPNDTLTTWMQRVEEAKTKIDNTLREHLQEQGTGFGSIQLNVWATAIKRPALSDKKTKGHEPYGVAELFRQCLHSAEDYDLRQATSASRLQNVMVAVGGLVAMLALAVVLLTALPAPTKGTPLDDELTAVLPKEEATEKEEATDAERARGTAERLRGTIADLDKKLAALDKIKKDARFSDLPANKQKEITQYEAEVKVYRDAYDKAKKELKSPHPVKDEKTYDIHKENLRPFELPAQWKETSLAKGVKQLRDEYATMDATIDKEKGWILEQIRLNTDLEREGDLLIVMMADKDQEKRELAREEAKKWKNRYQAQTEAEKRTSMPMLAFKQDGKSYAVDSAGRLLPPNTPIEGLPVYGDKVNLPKDADDAKWNDTKLAAAVRRLKLSYDATYKFERVLVAKKRLEELKGELYAIEKRIDRALKLAGS